MESLRVISVLGEVPTEGLDVNPIFEEPRAHSAKTLQTQHPIVVKEPTAPLLLRRKQRWDLIHTQLSVFVGKNFLALVPRRFMGADACTRYPEQQQTASEDLSRRRLHILPELLVAVGLHQLGCLPVALFFLQSAVVNHQQLYNPDHSRKTVVEVAGFNPALC